MGRPRKPAARRQNRSTKDTPRSEASIKAPPPPEHLLEETQAAWIQFWASGIAQYLSLALDLPSIERLFELRDERLAASIELAEGSRLVPGSKDQLRANPLIAYIKQLDDQILALEDRFAMNPKARAQAGVNLERAKPSSSRPRRSRERKDPRLSVVK